MKNRFNSSNRDPVVLKFASEISASFWSENEQERWDLISKHAERMNFLHSVPILIESQKSNLLESHGASQEIATKWGCILQKNLESINYSLRKGGRLFSERRWGDEPVSYFDPEQFKLEAEIEVDFRVEDSYNYWLMECVARAAFGAETTLHKIIKEYLDISTDGVDDGLKWLWSRASDLYPFWWVYDIDMVLWDRIFRSPRRCNILAVLGKLNRGAGAYTAKHKFPDRRWKGILETHLFMAEQLEPQASIPAFGNAILLDAAINGISSEDFSEVRKLQDRLFALCGPKSKARWQVDEYNYPSEMKVELCREFILQIPCVDRRQFRLIIAAAGLGAKVALRRQANWPSAVKKPEALAGFGLSDFLGQGDNKRLEEMWSHLLKEGILEGSWADLGANKDVLLMLDYSPADRESIFFIDTGGGFRSWPRESWFFRAERRNLKDLLAP